MRRTGTRSCPGRPAMVGSLKSALRRSGARRIHTDVFIGY